MAKTPRNPSSPVRRPVDQRTYMIRRAVALSVLFLMVFGAYSLFAVLVGGDGTTTAGSGSTVPRDQVSIPTIETTVPPTTLVPPPTPDNPSRVAIFGDSDAGGFGPYLKLQLDQTGLVMSTLDYKASTGLSRPDYHNWPEHLQGAVAELRPDIVVVAFGGNDAQGLANPDGSWVVGYAPASGNDDEAWAAEYGKRVGEVMDFLQEDGRVVIWVGIPNAADADTTARMKVQDDTVRAQVAAHPGVIFIDTWARFAGGNGGWAEYIVDPRDGQGKDVRSDDGFHLNEVGAEILALDIAEAVKNVLRSAGAQV